MISSKQRTSWGTHSLVVKRLRAGIVALVGAAMAVATSPAATAHLSGSAPPVGGTVVVWGSNWLGELTVPTGLSGVTAISAGNSHNLALKSDGTVVAWGSNEYEQLRVPAGLSGVTAISAGGSHSLALKSDGTVVAWGMKRAGQTTVPAGLSGVTAISAGGVHSLALKSDGTVVAWGGNYNGQASVPAGLSGVIAIEAGILQSMALKNDGTVVVWGDDDQGAAPVGLSDVTAIAAGQSQSLALKGDGTVAAWRTSYFNGPAVPPVPAGLSGVTALAAGAFHGLALKGDGTVVAWGDSNYSGEQNVPAGLSGVTAIAAHGTHSMALVGGPPPQTYTTTVKSGVPLLGGTTDIGNHCGSENVPDELETPCTTRIALPFPVTFYGVRYTSAVVDVAGNIQFTGDATRTYGRCFPDPSTGAAFAVFSAQTMTTSERPGLGIFTAVHGTAPNRTFVVEWRVAFTPTSSASSYAEWNFEAQFREGSSTLNAVFGRSWANLTYDKGSTFVHTEPAKWQGVTGTQDGLGNATRGCPSTLSTGYSTPDTGQTPAAGVAVSYTPSATPPGTVEQDSAGILYSGTWAAGKCGTTTCSPDNKQKNSAAAGARVKFSYTGKRADWVASRGPNGGKVGVYVDGVLKTTVDLYSPVIVDGMTVYTGSIAARKVHTLELKRISGRINVDAFRIQN